MMKSWLGCNGSLAWKRVIEDCSRWSYPGNEPFGGKFLDLVMMLIPGGKERTEDEYRTLFGEAGFELTRVVRTATEISIVEGAKGRRTARQDWR